MLLNSTFFVTIIEKLLIVIRLGILADVFYNNNKRKILIVADLIR